MTQEEKTRITEFRNNGVGYTRISKMLGLSENTVKTFCRRNGLTGNRGAMHQDNQDRQDNEIDHHEQNVQNAGNRHKGKENQFCLYCGAPIEQTPGRKVKKFCSDRCRAKWWSANQSRLNRKTSHEFVCPACGKMFTSYDPKRKYCCHSCYVADRFGKSTQSAEPVSSVQSGGDPDFVGVITSADHSARIEGGDDCE